MIPLITNPVYSYQFDAKHRFPMEKFGLLHTYLKETGIATHTNLFRPGRVKPEVLELGHCPDYIQRFVSNQLTHKEVRRMGLPWSEGLVRRTLISPNGTLLTARLALKYGIACHLAGGTHHAHYNFASGFCIFNDLAITARTLVEQGKLERVLIFDCDVHQGDGTANILKDEPRIFTCSIHCDKNFPARKAHSDLDVEVPAGTTDQGYLSLIDQALENIFNQFKPSLVLYDAGVDIYKDDPLGLLNISEQGIRDRDRLVLEKCLKHTVPVATVIGGGYDKNRYALARRHAIVTEQATEIFPH